MKIHAYAGAMLLLALAFSGCGSSSDGINREAVSGAVMLDGKPLPDGSILFSPMETGPSAGGVVVGGKFSIPRSDGPAPGSYRVEIISVQPTGKKIPDLDGPPGSLVEEKTNVVPRYYNTQSELRAEVKPNGSNAFEFQLRSASKKVLAKRRF